MYEPDEIVSRYCTERHPGTGYACCGKRDHDGEHYVTNGQMLPPGFYVAYKWPRTTSAPPEKP